MLPRLRQFGGGGGGAGGGGGMDMGDGTFISPDGQVMNYNEAVNYITGLYPGLVSSVNPSVTQNVGSSTTYYNYSTGNGQYSFETPNDHGASTYQDDDMYYFQGTTVKNIANISVSYDVSGGGDMSGWEIGGQANEYFDQAMTLTDANLYGAQKLANIATGASIEITSLAKISVIGTLAKVSGAATILSNSVEAAEEWKKGNIGTAIWKGTEALATTAFLIFGGEEIELLWNLGTMAIDDYRKFHH
jgi:hypothetical protein